MPCICWELQVLPEIEPILSPMVPNTGKILTRTRPKAIALYQSGKHLTRHGAKAMNMGVYEYRSIGASDNNKYMCQNMTHECENK